MSRYKLTLEYDGTGYVGWQAQENGLSIQVTVETAIKSYCGEDVRLHVAGRTDAGVHALGQVAHVDINRADTPETIQGALNYYLQDSGISILNVESVSDDFHARFSAQKRAYVYRILNRRAPTALLKHRVWWISQKLDIKAMQKGAQHLIGHHDFTTFRASECQAESPLKTLDQLDILEVGEEIHFQVSAKSFLHHMVRNMVGTLVEVGRGKWDPLDVKKALDARSRPAGGPTAPPDGLYLLRVEY